MSALASRLIPFALAAALGVVGTGCTAPGPTESAAPTESVSTGATTAEIGTLIDVRTKEEFDSGHLEGAINIDFNQPNFADEIAKLDKEGTYTVYCRSGNRSAQAAQAMRAAGIARVTDVGGFEAAQQLLELPVVTP